MIQTLYSSSRVSRMQISVVGLPLLESPHSRGDTDAKKKAVFQRREGKRREANTKSPLLRQERKPTPTTLRKPAKDFLL